MINKKLISFLEQNKEYEYNLPEGFVLVNTYFNPVTRKIIVQAYNPTSRQTFDYESKQVKSFN